MFNRIVVGTDGSETAGEAVRQAIDLAKLAGAQLSIVSAYAPVPKRRLQNEQEGAPADVQYEIGPREDVNLVLDAAANGLGIALARPPLTKTQLAAGRIVAVDKRTVLNPVSYWLDRPEGRPRAAAAELARRIGKEAGLAEAKLEAFLKAER